MLCCFSDDPTVLQSKWLILLYRLFVIYMQVTCYYLDTHMCLYYCMVCFACTEECALAEIDLAFAVDMSGSICDDDPTKVSINRHIDVHVY